MKYIEVQKSKKKPGIFVWLEHREKDHLDQINLRILSDIERQPRLIGLSDGV